MPRPFWSKFTPLNARRAYTVVVVALGVRMRNAVIVVLLVAVAFFADRAVRLENQRYAMLIFMCQSPLNKMGPVPFWDFDCLDKVQTRTSWFWQLYYVVTDPAPMVDL